MSQSFSTALLRPFRCMRLHGVPHLTSRGSSCSPCIIAKMAKVNIPVLVGEKEELQTIAVTNEEYIQIMKGDERLLQKLITEELERRSANTVQQFVNDNNEITNNFNNTSAISDITEENQKNDENKETFTWPEKAILLLLELYREREHEFTTGLKRHNKLWSEIASELKNFNYNVSAVQVQNKMSSLKRTYKKIKDLNAKSGNHNSSWNYYSVMDSLFGEKSWVSPPAVASSDGPSTPSQLEPESSLCNSSRDFEDIVFPKSKKRKVEVILDTFISDLKTDRNQKKEERKIERQEMEKRKEQRWEALRVEKREMHNETSAIQRSLVDLLGKLIEKHTK